MEMDGQVEQIAPCILNRIYCRTSETSIVLWTWSHTVIQNLQTQYVCDRMQSVYHLNSFVSAVCLIQELICQKNMVSLNLYFLSAAC